MIITKIDIINDAYSKLRISGLTVDPTPEDISIALTRLAGVIGALPWDIGYIYPETIGGDDANSDSGLAIDVFDPVSTLLAYRVAPDFGKQLSPADYSDAMSVLARKFSDVEGSKYPETLPTGIANEYPNTINRYFYDGAQPSENIDSEVI